jgi:hypothetical protein
MIDKTIPVLTKTVVCSFIRHFKIIIGWCDNGKERLAPRRRSTTVFYIDPGHTPYLLLLFTLFIPVDRVTNHVCSGILY